MSEILDFVLQLALGIALTAWVIRRDMRRLPGEQLDRAWPAATFWVAVVVFNPLCIPIHFTRTRRSLAGLGLGVLWMIGTVTALWLASLALDAILGAPPAT